MTTVIFEPLSLALLWVIIDRKDGEGAEEGGTGQEIVLNRDIGRQVARGGQRLLTLLLRYCCLRLFAQN